MAMKHVLFIGKEKDLAEKMMPYSLNIAHKPVFSLTYDQLTEKYREAYEDEFLMSDVKFKKWLKYNLKLSLDKNGNNYVAKNSVGYWDYYFVLDNVKRENIIPEMDKHEITDILTNDGKWICKARSRFKGDWLKEIERIITTEKDICLVVYQNKTLSI